MLERADPERVEAGASRVAGARGARAAALVAGLALAPCLAAGLASCIASYQTVPWIDTRRYPAPMTGGEDLPPGVSEIWLPGPEVIEVVRLSDPVSIVRPGIDSSFPLAFWDKTALVNSGSAVHVDAGGRAEIIWDDGARLILVGPTTGVLGSRSRSEPAFIFGELEHASFHPVEPADLWLVGGARLTAEAGPVVLDSVREDMLRVDNRSGTLVLVRFRDELIELDVGQRVDLALLGEGSEPFASALGWEEDATAGFSVRLSGRHERSSATDALAVQAETPVEIEAFGVRVTLAAGERALLSRLVASEPPPPAPPPPHDGASRDDGDSTEPPPERP